MSGGIVTTIKAKCRRCYTCIRNCPAKAIRVVEGQAQVMADRCIACGNCVRVCAQHAKEVESGIETVEELLSNGDQVVACLAPSFPAAFYSASPGQLVAALKKLGFTQVMEVAFGAELVSRQYAELLERDGSRRIISTPCPALIEYVEKYEPSLIPHLARIVSPMIALGRVIKHNSPDSKVVFIGPCVAKKAEIKDENVAGVVEAVLTYGELRNMLASRDVHIGELDEEPFDGPFPGVGRVFPVSGGLLKTAARRADILENEILVTEGKENCMQVLRELAEGTLEAKFLDLLFCEGCIDGPIMESDLSVFARKEIVANFAKRRLEDQDPQAVERALEECAGIDLSRGFTDHGIVAPVPTEEALRSILRQVNKFTKEDELNCGACGYPTCRDKAVAVYRGLAEVQMCLPYLIEQLQQNLRELELLHRELQDTQEQLIQSEKLASMGQLAAGVAHELNNPLGIILLYGHLLLKEINSDDPKWADLSTIIDETTRCKTIVSGLLDFARQRQLTIEATDIHSLLEECLSRMEKQPAFAKAEIVRQFGPLPQMAVDAQQLRQVFLNIICNAAEAMPDGGTLTVKTGLDPLGKHVAVSITDTGCGIPEEDRVKLFTPFFTTKKRGKGTGLGLAIAYGIVKMHRGSIDVQSEVGKGTTFTVTLRIVPTVEGDKEERFLS